MNDPEKTEIVKPTNEIYGWVEQDSSIMFKAVTKFGDPVELSLEEAKDVATALSYLIAKLEKVN